eukprot:UN11878
MLSNASITCFTHVSTTDVCLFRVSKAFRLDAANFCAHNETALTAAALHITVKAIAAAPPVKTLQQPKHKQLQLHQSILKLIQPYQQHPKTISIFPSFFASFVDSNP